MTNAINYIDGLDGLAAGIVAIAAAALLLYGERLDGVGAIGPDNAGPLIAAAVLGVCLGFLPHNFHPARIFMGDAGALLLGLLHGRRHDRRRRQHRHRRSPARRSSSSPRSSSRS